MIPKGKILALDIGKSKVGVAVSDDFRQMAFGRGILAAVPRTGLFEKLAGIVLNDRVNLLLVGLPQTAGGGETAQTKEIRGWAGEFEKFLSKKGLNPELKYIDESFSTFEANQMLAKAGINRKGGKRLEDEMAAVILIHRYIDFKS